MNLIKRCNFIILLLLVFSVLCFNAALYPSNSMSETEMEKIEFHDDYFEQAVRELVNKPIGSINKEDVACITELNVSSCNISDLYGIEFFTNLISLDCSFNRLTALDLSSNSLLEVLVCEGNKISALDISGNDKLKYLYCTDNDLEYLDISTNKALTDLFCEWNLIRALDLKENLELVDLRCGGNPLSELDVSNNIKLTFLYFYDTHIKILDLTQNHNLETLKCYHNPELSILCLRGATNLDSIVCCENDLTSLDVSENNCLEVLNCEKNKISQINLSGANKLKEINCSYNLLKSIDISQLNSLNYLSCHHNLISNYADIKGLNHNPHVFVVLYDTECD